MATRSSHMFKLNGKNLLNIYIHFDGYPSGSPVDVINSLTEVENHNGFNCLLLQAICTLKSNTGWGNIYVYDISEFGNCNEDYLYEYSIKDGTSVINHDNILDVIEVTAYETFYENDKVTKNEFFKDTIGNYLEKYA